MSISLGGGRSIPLGGYADGRTRGSAFLMGVTVRVSKTVHLAFNGYDNLFSVKRGQHDRDRLNDEALQRLGPQVDANTSLEGANFGLMFKNLHFPCDRSRGRRHRLFQGNRPVLRYRARYEVDRIQYRNFFQHPHRRRRACADDVHGRTGARRPVHSRLQRPERPMGSGSPVRRLQFLERTERTTPLDSSFPRRTSFLALDFLPGKPSLSKAASSRDRQVVHSFSSALSRLPSVARARPFR